MPQDPTLFTDLPIVVGGLAGTEIVPMDVPNGDGTYTTKTGTTQQIASLATAAGSGTVTSVSVVSANGLAGTVATATSTPAITMSTTVTGIIKGNGTGFSAATAGTDFSLGTSALATGILKSTTATGALSIATGADLPVMTATVGGAVPTPPNNTTTFLRGDGTFATPAGGGTVTHTGNLTANSVVLGNGVADTTVVAGITTDGTSKLNLGVAGVSVGAVVLANATSGSITVAPVTGALGSVTLSLPAATDTLIGKATTDILTNKTYDTAGAGNVLKINGTQVSAVTGTGAVVLQTGGSLTNPTSNNFISLGTSTASAGGTTVLTSASNRAQILTGSSNQTYQLPDATTLTVGEMYVFNNNSSGTLTINNATPSTLYTVPAGGYVEVNLLANGTAAGTWDEHPLPPNTVQWGSGTAGLVMNTALSTTPTVSAGVSSATAPSFIPQRGSATTGVGGDSTHVYVTIGGTAQLTVSASGLLVPALTASSAVATDGSSNLVSVANTGTGSNVLGTSPTIATPVLNGTPTGTGVATAATASTLALRDANGNLTAVNHIAGFTTTATAAGTTALTVSSNQIQVFTGSTTQTVTLPTTSIVAGQSYIVINQSTGAVTVQSSGANTVTILAASTSAIFTAVVATPTTAANWNSQYLGLVVTSGKSLSVSNSLTLAGTDATTMTFPSTSSTVLTTGNTATITKGYTFTANSLGNMTNFTLDPTLGNYQYGTNHAAVTITAPASDCAISLLITNDATAGAITWSGFTVGSSTGDAFTTTNTNKFLVSIVRINGVATYINKALQ